MGPEERARVVDSLTGMMDATRLEDMVEELQQRLDEEARLRQEAEQRQRDAERRAAELLAELERLKGRR
jgi:chromosome condensin MukBEF ATPase and DNA-binding subunit MukB